MHRYMIRAVVLISFAACALLSARAEPAPEEFLQKAIAVQKAYFQSLEPVIASYRETKTEFVGDEVEVTTVHRRETVSGTSVFVEMDIRKENEVPKVRDGGIGIGIVSGVRRLVATPEQLCFFLVPDHAYLYEGLAASEPSSQNLRQSLSPKYYTFLCSSMPTSSLEEIAESIEGGKEYDVSLSSNSEDLVELRIARIKDGRTGWAAAFSLQKDEPHLMTSAYVAHDGLMIADTRVEYRETPEGLILPIARHERWYEKALGPVEATGDNGANRVKREVKVEVEELNVRVTDCLPAFDWRLLNMGDGTTVYHSKANGDCEQLVKTGDRLQPR